MCHAVPRGVYIVACQRGGVSNKPPWALGSDKTRGQGSFGLSNNCLQFFFLKETDRTFDPFLQRQGGPGPSQYILCATSVQGSFFLFFTFYILIIHNSPQQRYYGRIKHFTLYGVVVSHGWSEYQK